jgi:hypothetical protein
MMEQQQGGDPQKMLQEAIAGTEQAVMGFAEAMSQMPNLPPDIQKDIEMMVNGFQSAVAKITGGAQEQEPQPQEAMIDPAQQKRV